MPNQAQFPLAIPALSSLTNIEIMASEPAFPLKLAPSGLTESMLVPLINQFGFMQQQMFDQFQQAMAMMVQMFGTMHREQMEVIRAELDGLHDLTEEFHALKKELANRTQERDTTASSASTIAPEGLDRSTATEPIASAKATAGGVKRSESHSGGCKVGDSISIIRHPASPNNNLTRRCAFPRCRQPRNRQRWQPPAEKIQESIFAPRPRPIVQAILSIPNERQSSGCINGS